LAEDIEALRRIGAHLAEVRQRAHQATEEAEPSVTEMQTRANGKERQLTDAKAQEQYKQHKEEKLRY